MTVEIEDVRRLNVKPGEALLVRVPERMTPEHATYCRDLLRDLLPGIRVVVIAHDIQVDVVAAEAIEHLEPQGDDE